MGHRIFHRFLTQAFVSGENSQRLKPISFFGVHRIPLKTMKGKTMFTSTNGSNLSEVSSFNFNTSTAKKNGRTSVSVQHGSRPISEIFGELTFGLGHMRETLPRDAYQELLRALDSGKKFSSTTADAIAHVVKDWAVAKGATHFCHWFQPMTG